MRSVVKSKVGWQFDGAPSMLRAYLSGGSPDVKGAVEWLWKSSYQVVPRSPIGDEDVDKTEFLEIMKAMQEQNAAMLKGFAEAIGAVAKSQSPGGPPVLFNVQLPDKVDLTGSSFQIHQDPSPPVDMTPVAKAIEGLGEAVKPQPVDLKPLVEMVEKAISVRQEPPVVNAYAPDMRPVADAIRDVGKLVKPGPTNVNVTMPQQAPPTVINKVSAPPAQVTVVQEKTAKRKSKMTVIKDRDGNIVGTEKEDLGD